MEEPKEVAEELSIHQEKSWDVLQPQKNKTKLDAEKLVVKLLASRLVHHFFMKYCLLSWWLCCP